MRLLKGIVAYETPQESSDSLQDAQDTTGGILQERDVEIHPESSSAGRVSKAVSSGERSRRSKRELHGRLLAAPRVSAGMPRLRDMRVGGRY
jgi:hypothetical protein